MGATAILNFQFYTQNQEDYLANDNHNTKAMRQGCGTLKMSGLWKLGIKNSPQMFFLRM